MKNTIKYILILCIAFLCMSGCEDFQPIDVHSQEIIEDINSLYSVSLGDEEKILSLQERYNSLSDEQKEQVTNYTMLLEAEDKLEALKTEKLQALREGIIGSWIETSSNKNYYLMAQVKDDFINIYCVSMADSDIATLYWAGTYQEPDEILSEYSWESQNVYSRTQYGPLASQAETKTFTYKNNRLVFSGETGGEKFTAEMIKTDKTVVGAVEKEYEGMINNKFEYRYNGFNFYIPEVYETWYDGEDGYVFFAPNAYLEFSSVGECYLSDSGVEYEFEQIKNKWLDIVEYSELVDCYTESQRGKQIQVVEIDGYYSGTWGKVMIMTFYNKKTRSMASVVNLISANTDYDYSFEFYYMLLLAYINS